MSIGSRRLLGLQVLQAGSDILEFEHGILKLPPQVCLPGSQGLGITQYIVQSDFPVLYLTPQLDQG